MFEKNYSFRYGDLDCRQNIRVGTVLDILQDISTAHSAAAGFPLDRLYESEVALILHGWRIRFHRPLYYTSDAAVRTGIMKIRHFEGIRKYEIWQDGMCKVTATAMWIATDLKSRAIVKVPENIINAYSCIDEPDNGLPFIKLRDCPGAVSVHKMPVEARDIDTNNHLNNAKSVEIALDYLPQNTQISELQITYKKELLMGDTLEICRADNSGGYSFNVKNGNSETCVLIKALQIL